MTKYELAKLFSDVDDKYIEGARPVAQKAVMIKTSKSPMRIISAASCAAVLAGGIITITAVHNRDISALNDSNTASITSGGANISNSTDIKDSSEMTDSTVSLDERPDNYFTSDHICYEGEYYTVVKDASEYGVHITLDMWHITFATGIRISSDNTIDVVTVIKNISNMPIGMLDIGDSSGIRLGFHKKSEGNQPGITGTDAEKHVTKVLQPGEELYEKQSFDLFYGECWGTLQFDYGDLDGAHIDPDSEKNLVFTGEITEDGFKEHNGNYNWYTEDQIYYAGKYYKVMPDPAFGFDYPDSVGIMMGIRKTEQNTIDIVAVVKNNYDKPVEIEGNDFGLIYDMTLEPKPEQEFTESDFKNRPGDLEAIILKPGAVCYQWESFDLFYGEFMGKWQIAYKNPNSGNRIESRGVYYGEMTENGFREYNEAADEWAQKPLVLPSKSAPEDLDFVNTGNGLFSQNTLIPADIGSEVYAVEAEK